MFFSVALKLFQKNILHLQTKYSFKKSLNINVYESRYSPCVGSC
jgi:hypothetical protein